VTVQSVAPTTDRGMVERRALEIIDGFVRELGTLPSRGSVTPGDVLDRDLGIGSLERVELFLRLEEAFGVHLGDAVMTEAETCRDLVDAVVAGEAAGLEAPPAPGVTPEAGRPAPASARTLLEVLRWHAERQPDRVHIFLRLEDGREQPITYGTLWAEAQALAAALRDRGAATGESVALMLRTEPAFFSTFFGILLAGAVPVPIYPPFRPERLEEYAVRQIGILKNAQAGCSSRFVRRSAWRCCSALASPRSARSWRSMVSVDGPAHPNRAFFPPNLQRSSSTRRVAPGIPRAWSSHTRICSPTSGHSEPPWPSGPMT
jgi:acyl carrier protein